MVTAAPAAEPPVADEYCAWKLALETDPSDVYSDLSAGHGGFIVVDARPLEVYERADVLGAVSMPYRRIDEGSTSAINREDLVVVYCWGPNCNAAAKAGMRLAGWVIGSKK